MRTEARATALRSTIVSALVMALAHGAYGETGREGWLRYRPIGDPAVLARYERLPATVVVAGDSPVLRSARDELTAGLGTMLGRPLRQGSAGDARAIVIGTADALERMLGSGSDVVRGARTLAADGYLLRSADDGRLTIAARNDRGVLYGAFALLRRVALYDDIARLNERAEPSAPVRWVNEWNNLDGSIERGYAGPSIFFEHGNVAADLTRAREYARLLSSIGINACAVNNVNADVRVMSDAFLPQLTRLADAFRPWGVQLAISVDFSSPRRLGGLDTFDPLDARVASFWRERVEAIYRAVPDLAGFVLKADSEGRLGPSAYGRTHADAANAIARALAPHQGLLFYRGFVYDHHMDWRNPKNDRARAAVDNFAPLDGRFDANVIVQIKHGPIDFQVREPVSPLFGVLEKTNQAIELQVTQEYTGQQRHVVYLVPMWKEVLDFDLHARGPGTPVREIVSGRTFDRPTGGYVAVSNVGRDENWLGHDLAMANLYGFGRLAWTPSLSSFRIAEEWARLTFGHEPKVVESVASILIDSWPAYEDYTGPLGVGTLTDIIGVHFGPGIESSERNGWGQWHKGDEHGIGMDRTVATGTGFVGQYRRPVAAMYESLDRCPDELLLFFHHVPYTHVLHSGKTLIQHVYDRHYRGAATAADFVRRWRAIEGLVDGERHDAVERRLAYQAGHAVVWRDAVCQWFRRMSGVADAKGRVGQDPNRTEAESMTVEGYTVQDVTPWETASGAKAVGCANRSGCTASVPFARDPGTYDIAVQYYDENDGVSRYRLLVAGRQVATWSADDTLPSNQPNGHTATRRTIEGVSIGRGDAVRIEAVPDGGEQAVLDYVEIVPSD
jgi:alpha-glucuronidase